METFNSEKPTTKTYVYSSIPLWFYIITIGAFLHPFGFGLDISWHMSVGKDRIFTPPHILMLSQMVLCFFVGVYLVLEATWLNKKFREVSINFGKFWGPTGAWYFIWGFVIYAVAFVYDEWWHTNYGLDVTLDSPSHYFIQVGIIITGVGILCLFFMLLNNMSKNLHHRLWIIGIFLLGCRLAWWVYVNEEVAFSNYMHNASFYYNFYSYAILLVLVLRQSPISWIATWASLVPTFMILIMQLILPLIPAKPLLSPIYNPVTHLLPVPFFIILLPTAISIDFFYAKFKKFKDFPLALIVGTASFLVFFVTHWFYGEFQLSKFSDNFFLTKTWLPYFIKANEPWWKQFWITDIDSQGNFSLSIFLLRLAIAYIMGIAAIWFTWKAMRTLEKIRK